MGFSPDRIRDTARSAIKDRANALYLSIASAWEILEKDARGKLTLPEDATTYLKSRLARSQAKLLPIALEHIFALRVLPDHHRDPFDRMIVAQAMVEDMRLVTADAHVLSYPVATLDARR